MVRIRICCILFLNYLDHYIHIKSFPISKVEFAQNKNTSSESISTHYRYLTNRTKKKRVLKEKGAQYRDAMRWIRDSSLSADEIYNSFFVFLLFSNVCMISF